VTHFNQLHHVAIRFADGSHAMFRHAFDLVDRDMNEIAVFTEHCGYRFFPLYDTRIELLDSVNTDVGTDELVTRLAGHTTGIWRTLLVGGTACQSGSF